jgi:hypothetical protein
MTEKSVIMTEKSVIMAEKSVNIPEKSVNMAEKSVIIPEIMNIPEKSVIIPEISNKKGKCGKCGKILTIKTLEKYNGICGLCDKAGGNISPPKKIVIPKKIREACWIKYVGNTITGDCYSCKCAIQYTDFSAGHIQSEYDGGKITINNIRPICKRCNSSCGVLNLDIFKRSLCDNEEKELPTIYRSDEPIFEGYTRSQLEKLIVVNTNRRKKEKFEVSYTYCEMSASVLLRMIDDLDTLKLWYGIYITGGSCRNYDVDRGSYNGMVYYEYDEKTKQLLFVS